MLNRDVKGEEKVFKHPCNQEREMSSDLRRETSDSECSSEIIHGILFIKLGEQIARVQYLCRFHIFESEIKRKRCTHSAWYNAKRAFTTEVMISMSH